jgi:acetyltransferase
VYANIGSAIHQPLNPHSTDPCSASQANGAEALRVALLPRSVAIVGASPNESRLGSKLVRSVTECGFGGELHLVGSGGICYEREILPSLSAIGSPVDLVLVAVRNTACPEVVAEAGDLGAGCALILANGFAEAGNVALSQALLDRATESNITVIGPNTMGIFSAPARLNAMEDVTIPAGRVAVVSQSGNVGIAIYEALKAADLGLSCFVSLGNQLMVGASDVLRHLTEDSHTDSVLLYLEGMPDPAAFLDAAASLAREKPVAVLRGGVTAEGARAAASHTGALATDEVVISAALRESGVIDVRSVHELVLIAQSFSGPVRSRGRRVGIVADSGGFATLGADVAARAGLTVDPHSAEIQSALREIVVPQASVDNPVDLIDGVSTDSPEIYQHAVEICIESENVDCVLLAGAYGGYEVWGGPQLVPYEVAAAKALVEARDVAGKPLVLQTIYARNQHEGFSYLREHHVPVVESLEDAVGILARQATWNEGGQPPRTSWAEREFGTAQGRTLREDVGRAWFTERLDVELPPSQVVTSDDEAVQAQADLGGQLVMKLLSHVVSHKTEVGGVVVGIETEDDMREAWARMARICRHLGEEPAALVTPFVYPGLEVLVGAIKSSPVGPIVLVGAGGIYTEDLADRTVLFPPFTRIDVEQAIDRLKVVGPALNSPRAVGAARDGLVDLAVKVGQLVVTSSDLIEMDLNPVVLGPNGASILDVRVAVSGALPSQENR